ncbi:MAG: AhpC/TSA family protein [Odoribacteraceae bacterium]|jgi:thiol-disulfide isomerase/thioredoxin|nr:AhpC/TSA family protein [Odoribacteraceae bacterium]
MKLTCNILLVIAALAASLPARAASDGFALRGILPGVPDGATVALVPVAERGDNKPVASTTLRDGRFEITGDLDSPRLFRLQVGTPPLSASYALCIGPGELLFEATITRDGDRWQWHDPRLSGSPVHDAYLEKTRFRKRLDEQHAAMQERHRDISRKVGAARVSNDTATMNALRRTTEYANLERDERAFFRLANDEINAAIAANGDSFWGPLLMLANYNYFTPGDTVVTGLYARFSDEAKRSRHGQILQRELFPPRLVDLPAPRVSLPDRDGSPRELHALLAGKRLLVIDFWASWCAPCRQEIPRLKELYSAFAPAGLEIVSISIDKDRDAWIKAMDAEQMPWPQLRDAGDVNSKLFFVKAIPALFVVDSSGVVLHDLLRGTTLRDFIAARLAPGNAPGD